MNTYFKMAHMDEHHYLLIIGYLEGKISEEETQYLLQKVQTDKEFSDAFEDIAEIWSARKPVPNNSIKANDALNRLNKKIDQLETPSNEQALPKPNAIILKLRPVLAVAASVLLLACAFWFYKIHISNKTANTFALIENHTAPGQKKKINLPDGTIVTLNASSNLHIAGNFDDEKREVYLDGEAFFDVKRNPQKPFIVHTGKVATQVLGTHFNVSAYVNDSNITVSLVEGKVQVDMNNDPSKRVILDPGKQMIYSKSDGQARVTDFITEDITGWKENKLVFNYDSWTDAAKKLSRWYGVPVKLQDSTLLRCKLKGTFDNIPLNKVMEQIKMVSDISWKMQGKAMIISGKCN
ncbi:FecR family protein [Mucilaginibacter kameinonensis]|uniref:FecR family protein n=1 Tax=Mucilaginibacter kameinonensis TaxID=452286 RepID=UPI0013CE4CF8|nr:FecR domain-containing protein [Mucilaginibacter kameinonensis]